MVGRVDDDVLCRSSRLTQEHTVLELALLDKSIRLSSHALSVEHVVLVEALLNSAVGKCHLTLAIQFVILELSLLDSTVDEDLLALAVELMTLEYAFLESFLVYVDAKTVEAVLAVVVSYHLSGEGPLLFFGVIYDPNSTYIDLLVELWSVLDRN